MSSILPPVEHACIKREARSEKAYDILFTIMRKL